MIHAMIELNSEELSEMILLEIFDEEVFIIYKIFPD